MTLQAGQPRDCQIWHSPRMQSAGSNPAWHPMGSTASRQTPHFMHAQGAKCRRFYVAEVCVMVGC